MRKTLRYLALLAAIASTSSLALAQDDATQAGRRQADQSPLSTQDREGQAGQPGQARTPGAQPGQPGARAAQGAGMNVTQFFAHDLRRGNEAEVELGRLASEKAENDQVKKFAQMMVEHHTQFAQQLQQMEQRGNAGQGAPGAAAPGALRQRVGQSEPDSQGDATNPGQSDQNQGTTRRGQGNVRNSESGTDGEREPQGAGAAAGGTSQATTTAGQAPGTTTPGSPRATAGQAAGQGIPGQAGVAGAHMMGGQVPHQLVAVLDQAADTELQMTKQMLQEYQGQDFEMGYIGQQIVAHTCMLAKLQALKNSGPQELQQMATQGEQTARQHLDMAKQIAQQLKDKDSAGSATRSANSSAKQPSTQERDNK